MEFTTHFGLQSQTTRLTEEASCATVGRSRARGYHPLRRAFPRQLREDRCSDGPSPDYNSPTQCVGDYRLGLFPLHSPLLGESWLVSFPPLINMLKFSGSSHLT